MNIASWLRSATTLIGMTMAMTGCAEKSGPPVGATASGAATATSNTVAVAKTNPAVHRAVPAWPPTQAQPKLRTLKLYVGPEVITAELAMNQIEVGTGMMFRTSMAEDEGMLFVFANPHRTSFYMRNTTVPLTAAYIDPQGTILELVELNPLVEAPVEAKFDNIQYVLEMNRGWFKRHNVSVGTVVSTERGSLPKTFGMGN